MGDRPAAWAVTYVELHQPAGPAEHFVQLPLAPVTHITHLQIRKCFPAFVNLEIAKSPRFHEFAKVPAKT
jgi:hypothetical protein